MKKWIKVILISILVCFGLIVAWMNVTPGYFQEHGSCACEVEYLTEKPHSHCPVLTICSPSLLDITKLALGKLDFNR